MADKLLISTLTWRSLEMQKQAFPDMPFFTIDEISSMLRPTRRQVVDRIHVLSLACIADDEKHFRNFLAMAKQRGCHIISKEENQEFIFKKGTIEYIVNEWKMARNRGAAKIGGRISAKLREEESQKACAIIADRWPLPDTEWRTPVLLKEANAAIGKKKPMAYNTAIKYLGKRPIAQYNYQAKLKRKANAKR